MKEGDGHAVSIRVEVARLLNQSVGKRTRGGNLESGGYWLTEPAKSRGSKT
jgi:hypothetical protein